MATAAPPLAPRLRNLLRHLAPARPPPADAAPPPAPLQPVACRDSGPPLLPSGEPFERWSRASTTRPELQGTFGMVASHEQLASAAGMRVLELGGNAFDAAVATGLALWHTVPGSNGPGGEVSIVFRAAADGRLMQVCGQGVMPAAATLERFAALGVKKMPGGGTLLSACTPGAFDAYMLLLGAHGTLRPREALEPLLRYARVGVPTSPGVYNDLGRSAARLVKDWPSSAAAFLQPNGAPPPKDGRWANPTLAACFERLLDEGEAAAAAAGAGGGEARRQAEIAGVRRVFAQGFVAEAIAEHCTHAFMNPRSGTLQPGLLTVADMAGYAATLEPCATYDYHGWTVGKCGPWSQGPVFLQQLALLKGVVGFEKMAPDSAEFIHTVVEAGTYMYSCIFLHTPYPRISVFHIFLQAQKAVQFCKGFILKEDIRTISCPN
jgi:gamma-glutamyltranspeptidase/glutathione hydrolase